MHIKFLTRKIKHLTSRKWGGGFRLGGGVQWLFYFVKSHRSFRKYSFHKGNVNEPVIAIRGNTFHN